MTAESSSPSIALPMRGQWARVFAFVKRPVLPARAGPVSRAGLRAVLQLFALDLVISGALLAIGYAIMAIGVELPKTALAKVEIGPLLMALVVILAPVMEEIVFRGWLSGRPGHLLAYLAMAGGWALAIAAVPAITGAAGRGQQALTLSGIIAAAAIMAALSLFLLRRRDAMGWFAAAFPVFYWLSAIVFAAVHLINFGDENLVMVLPLVLPQFVLALILGYTRVTFGLWSCVLLHMLHNGAVLSLALAARGLAG